MTRATLDRDALWSRSGSAVAGLGEPPATPILVVDLDAFDANAEDLVRRAAGKPVRVASKSVRVPELLRRVLDRPGFRGVLSFTLREALWLHEHGVCDDIVVAYPSVDRPALRRLAASPSAAAAITLMVDEPAHLDVIDAARSSPVVPLRVAIDVDAGLRIGGQHVGPKRSPLYDPAAVAAFAREVGSRRGLRLVGVMTYEGQVAGLPDAVPSRRARSLVVRRLKSASVSQLRVRRRGIAEALAGVVDLEFWNARGSGSVETTTLDPHVTELAAVSGLLGLPVVRRPSAAVATVHGGGLVASGVAGRDRLPVPWAPSGLHLTALEGAGEVQTPLTGPAAGRDRVGDLVWFRHAKSGVLFEHGTDVHLLAGASFAGATPTYRGLGLAF